MRYLFRNLILVSVLLPCSFAATVILVRHAERAGDTAPDVPLSAAGQRRAKELARVLGDAGVQVIYTSEVARTAQTAAPLAKQLAITPVTVPARDNDGLVAKLRALDPDQVALVVGHSNTIPAIAEQLGGKPVRQMHEPEFDRMLIVFTSKEGPAKVLTLRYGAPSAAR
jgi:broad specificity phosphatase PhoE